MGKKKDKKISKEDKLDFRRGLESNFYGPGNKARELLDRYNVDPSMRNSVKPSARNLPEHFRTTDNVQAELQEAMMNDYDTRRSLEAAALAGNKDAKKFARKGIDGVKGMLGAWDVMKDLKKEYVGGGGMRGAKNEAGLTQAIVEADRKKLQEDLANKADAATPDGPKPPPEAQFSISEEEDFDNNEELEKRIDKYESDRAFTGLIGDDDTQDYMENYKFNVASGLRGAGVDTRGENVPDFIL